MSVPIDKLNEVGGDLFRYRMDNFDGARHALTTLHDAIETLPPPEFDKFRFLRKICRLWLALLDNASVRNDYGRTPQLFDNEHWLGTFALNDVQRVASDASGMIEYRADIEVVNQATYMLIHHFRKACNLATKIHISGPDAVTEMRTFIGPLLTELDSLQEEIRRFEEERARAAVDTLQEQANEGAQALEAIKRASGSFGDVAISSFYKELGTTEASRANRFRVATIVLGALGGLAAFGFLLLPPDIPYPAATDADRYVRLIQKFVFVSGIFGLAAYLSRQSSQHRALANWANTLEVQLRTFEAYLFDVSTSDVRDELRKSFAVRAFGDHPNSRGELPETSASSLAAAVELVTKTANALPGSKGAG